jgi:glycosyltransferase involved in cell wall biosynthesis
MRVGLLAYSTDTGLGRQTHDFFVHMKPYKTLLVDISHLNGVETHHERFPGARICEGIPVREEMEWLTDDVDAIFVCETPLDYRLFDIATRKGVVSILQFNPEFLDYFSNPNLAPPTVLAAPTWWMHDKVKELNIAPVLDWNVPVDEDRFEHREITRTTTFGHIVGRAAIHDRNGTTDFLTAAHLLNSRHPGNSFKYEIYIQHLGDHYNETMTKIDQYKNLIDVVVYEDMNRPEHMYSTIDVLVMPRRFGGLCLPMQEALCSGVPVIMPNTEPNYQFLPPQWLVPAFKQGQFPTRTMIDIYNCEIEPLVDVMEAFGKSQVFTRWSNKHTQSMREKLGWNHMHNRYTSLIEQACLTSQS